MQGIVFFSTFDPTPGGVPGNPCTNGVRCSGPVGIARFYRVRYATGDAYQGTDRSETQTAASFDFGTGWSTLAKRYGFALLMPEQQGANNANTCFNWFNPEDTARDSGEACSIRQMIARAVDDIGIDRHRIFITGLSAGGAMTSVMLATYPEVFAAGAVIAGLPYGTATNVKEAFESMGQVRARSAREIQLGLKLYW